MQTLMRTLCLTLFLLGAPSAALTQEIRRDLRADAPLPSLDRSLEASVALAPSTGSHLGRRILSAAGGAAVGAFVGYMASQVMVGSWEEQPGIRRENWATGGAVFGLSLGLALPGSRPGGRTAPEPTPRRDVLTREEVQDNQGGSLYEIIRSTRPEWLRTRGIGSMRETPRGAAAGGTVVINPGIPSIRVYLDDVELGGVNALRSLAPGMVEEVVFLDSAAATHRWGAGHLHGAILVRTLPL